MLKSGRPQISPGSVKNGNIENPQTLSEYIGLGKLFLEKITFSSIGFLFYAFGNRVASEALRSVFAGSRPYFT